MGRFAAEVEFFSNLTVLKIRVSDRQAVIGLYFVLGEAALIRAVIDTCIYQSCDQEDDCSCSIGNKS